MSSPLDPTQFTRESAERIANVVRAAELATPRAKPLIFPREDFFRRGGSPIRLGQCQGPWPNEPPLNVRTVRLFKQPTNPSGPSDWIPETDSFGDPVFAVTINWFTHIPVGQGDLLKWCAVVPISDLAGSYDTGQVTYENQQEIPILRPYSKLWLLIAVEC